MRIFTNYWTDLKHGQVPEEAGDHLRHDLILLLRVLGVEVQLPQVFTAGGGAAGAWPRPDQRPAEVDQADVSDLGGEADVEEGEAGAGVGHHPEHRVSGDVLDVEGAEAAALGQTGQGEVSTRGGGEECEPGAGPGGDMGVSVEVEDQAAQSVSTQH